MENKYHYHFGIALNKIREEAIQLHCMRYLEVGFFEEGEKDPYEQDSLYFVARETTLNQVVGVTRLIFKPIEQLPTINNFEIYDIDLARVIKLEKRRYAEMSAFTKLPKHEVGVHLIRTIFHYSNQHGITHWIACIDDRVYRYLNRIFSSIFKEIGVPKVYLGSVTVPCVVNLPEAMKQIKEQRPKLYEFLKEANEQVMEVSR
ncbi:MAG: N-acyl amino acid synthase FeeM domain-containing protein [Bacillota bacterium]